MYTSWLKSEILSKCGKEKNRVIIKSMLDGKGFTEIFRLVGIQSGSFSKRRRTILKRLSAAIPAIADEAAQPHKRHKPATSKPNAN